MGQTNDGGLRLALERLKWALAMPARPTDDEWFARVRRALAFLQTAWDDHAAVTNSEFAQLLDPSFLPFSPLSQRLGEFRDEHSTLRGQLAALDNQAEEGSRLDLLCRSGRLLVDVMERHVAAERALPCEQPSDPLALSE
jgi:hypothetical protein